MVKEIKDFSELKDFNQECSALASLCVSLRSIIFDYEEADYKINSVLASGEKDGATIKTACKSIERLEE